MYNEIKINELSIIQILKMTINIFRRNAKSFMIATFMIFIPINIATSLIPMNEALNNLNNLLPNTQVVDYSTINFSPIMQAATQFLKWYLLSFSLQKFFGCIAIMSVALITYKIIQGIEFDYKLILEEVFSKWIWAVLIIIISIVFTIWGYIMFIIPSIIFAVYTCFMLYAFILKNHKGLEPLRYSFKVVRFRFWKTFLRLSFITVFQYAIIFIISQLFNYIPINYIVIDFISSSLFTFISIFFWIFQTIWFINYDYVKAEIS